MPPDPRPPACPPIPAQLPVTRCRRSLPIWSGILGRIGVVSNEAGDSMKTAFNLGACAIALVGIGGVATASDAHASELYGAVRAGQSTNTSVSGIDLNDGFSYGGAVGGAVGPIRVELAGDHLSGDFAGIVNAKAMDYSASAILDLPISHNTAIFGGAGVDYVSAEAHVPFGSYDASGNGWSYQAGVSHRFASGVMGEVRYKHTEVNDLDVGGGSADLSTDQITAGVRFAL